MWAEEEIRILGYCEECGRAITGDDTEMYIDKDGYHFCSVECVLEHYDIDILEI